LYCRHKILTDSLHQPSKRTESTKYECHMTTVQVLLQTRQARKCVASTMPRHANNDKPPVPKLEYEWWYHPHILTCR